MPRDIAQPGSRYAGTKAAVATAATVAAAALGVPMAGAVLHAADDQDGSRAFTSSAFTSSAFTAPASAFTPSMPSTIPGTLIVPIPGSGPDAPPSPSARRDLWSGSIRAADASNAALRIRPLPLPVDTPPVAAASQSPARSFWARATRLVAPPVPAKRVTAARVAMTAMGTPYVWGGARPGGFDCSGLVQWAYRKAGILVPRTSREQSIFGTPIARQDLRPGDLVFFYRPVHHVGIYLGNGNVLHAPQTGDVVKISPLSRMPLSGARRI